MVWRLDRLGRSLRHLIETVTALAERKVGFRSLTENIDTTTTGGKLVFHLFGALAEFERDLIRDRTMAGLTAARARGRVGGRPPALSGDKLAVARQMHTSRQHSMQAIADVVDVSRATLYRHLAKPLPPVSNGEGEEAKEVSPTVRTGQPAGGPACRSVSTSWRKGARSGCCGGNTRSAASKVGSASASASAGRSAWR